MPPKSRKIRAKVSPTSTVLSAPAVEVVRGRDGPHNRVMRDKESLSVASLPPSTLPSHSPSSSLIDSSLDEPIILFTLPILPSTEQEGTSARCRPLTGRTPLTARKASQLKIPPPLSHQGTHHPFLPLTAQSRLIQLYVPDMDRTAPIRLPSTVTHPSDPLENTPTVSVEGVDDEEEGKERDKEEEERVIPTASSIKLRHGWGYKIGTTKFRAVYDPKRASIPKLPLRGPGGYSVSPTTATKETTPGKAAVCLYVNPFEDIPTQHKSIPPPLTKRSTSKSVGDYLRLIDREAAEAVKKCYDQRMADDASSSSSPTTLGALIRITTNETVQLPSEHVYTHPQCVHKADIITTFPLQQVSHYQKKKYKDDHVVISSSNIEDIYTIVHRIRHNKRRWARVKERVAIDEEYRARMADKKTRAYAAEKAKIAAMSVEERKMINIRKYAYEKAKRLENDPEQMAKKERLEERRLANLAKNKALLAAGIQDPEEKRRVQRRIRAAERTPEERAAWIKMNQEYYARKKARMKGANVEELRRMEEEKRAKEEEKAALAALTPKERMRTKQRIYEANYKAKRQARELENEKGTRTEETISPSKKRGVKRRRVERKKKEEEEEEEERIEEEHHDHMDFSLDERDNYEENELAVQAISSPSPIRQTRPLPSPLRTSHSSYALQSHHHQLDMAGPSTSRLPPRYVHRERDMETELIQLQKDVVWSERAIHNSRVEAYRLREEADSLDSAIEEELIVQRERRRRIAQLNAIWREEHGEDSQG